MTIKLEGGKTNFVVITCEVCHTKQVLFPAKVCLGWENRIWLESFVTCFVTTCELLHLFRIESRVQTEMSVLKILLVTQSNPDTYPGHGALNILAILCLKRGVWVRFSLDKRILSIRFYSKLIFNLIGIVRG